MVIKKNRNIKVNWSFWAKKEIFWKAKSSLDEVKEQKNHILLKILTGDLLSHYPFGKIFIIDDLA